MNDFRSGAPAAVVDSSLKSALQTMENAKQNAVLWFGEVLERRLYRELGYSSMQQYAEVELAFSKSRTGDFLSICRRLEKLPAVRKELSAGRLGYTKAREVVKVADAQNEREWVEVARTRSRRELEREVKRARQAARVSEQASLLPVQASAPPASPPVRVTLEMSATQFARYEALWERLRKLGHRGDRVDEMLEALGTLADVTESNQRGSAKPAPRGARPGAVIHIHECPTCKQAAVPTSRGEKPVDAERHRCDATVIEPEKRARQTIPPGLRRRIHERDRNRCQAPGCQRTQFLEIHHQRPVSRGGTNDPDNLVTLCRACHSLVHARRHDRQALDVVELQESGP